MGLQYMDYVSLCTTYYIRPDWSRPSELIISLAESVANWATLLAEQNEAQS